MQNMRIMIQKKRFTKDNFMKGGVLQSNHFSCSCQHHFQISGGRKYDPSVHLMILKVWEIMDVQNGFKLRFRKRGLEPRAKQRMNVRMTDGRRCPASSRNKLLDPVTFSFKGISRE